MCKEREFDPREAIASQGRELARLTELVATLEARLAGAAPGSARSAGGMRAGAADQDDAETVADGGGGNEDPRIREMVEAAPPEIRDRILEFARTVAEDGQIARQERPPRSADAHLRVVGGGAVPAGAFLHCACIGLPAWGCTGVVVAPQVVLTAAHCGDAINRVMVGGTTVLPVLSSDARVVGVRQAVVHPDYDDPSHRNDITVLILDAPARVPPAPLATFDEISAATAFDVVGFGYNDPTRPLGLGTKRRATVPLAAIMQRREGEDLGQLPQTLGFHPEYEFVAGRKHLGIDSCNGDSGGPIYVSVGGAFKVAGLTSRATRTAVVNCGDAGIYVRPDRFRAWIDQVAADAGVAPPG